MQGLPQTLSYDVYMSSQTWSACICPSASQWKTIFPPLGEASGTHIASCLLCPGCPSPSSQAGASPALPLEHIKGSTAGLGTAGQDLQAQFLILILFLLTHTPQFPPM